jgi:hypothetical protein
MLIRYAGRAPAENRTARRLREAPGGS